MTGEILEGVTGRIVGSRWRQRTGKERKNEQLSRLVEEGVEKNIFEERKGEVDITLDFISAVQLRAAKGLPSRLRSEETSSENVLKNHRRVIQQLISEAIKEEIEARKISPAATELLEAPAMAMCLTRRILDFWPLIPIKHLKKKRGVANGL